jgi:copper transport protein
MKRLTGMSLLAVIGVAHAHAHLLQANPADGSVLSRPPTSFEFKFNEAATLTALSLQKAGGSVEKVPLSSVKAATDISVAAPALGPGSYTLTYRVLSDDHHIVSGQLQFKVSG